MYNICIHVHVNTQKKGLLGALQGTITQFGLDACLNLNKECVESEEAVMVSFEYLIKYV